MVSAISVTKSIGNKEIADSISSREAVGDSSILLLKEKFNLISHSHRGIHPSVKPLLRCICLWTTIFLVFIILHKEWHITGSGHIGQNDYTLNLIGRRWSLVGWIIVIANCILIPCAFLHECEIYFSTLDSCHRALFIAKVLGNSGINVFHGSDILAIVHILEIGA